MRPKFLTILGLRGKTPVEPASPSSDTGQKLLFFIEDSPECVKAMQSALAGQPYRIQTAATAESAISKLSSVHPDFILLNSQIVSADGTRLASRLLADEELISIPIVALASMCVRHPDSPETVGQFDGYVEWPIHPDTFPAQIHAVVASLGKRAFNHAAGFSIPAALEVDGRQQISIALDAILAGLPESQFAPATLRALRQLSVFAGDLERYALADYLQRAVKLSSSATVRARSRFGSLIRVCSELVNREPDVTRLLPGLRDRYLENRFAERSTLELALRNRDFAALGKIGNNLKGTAGGYGFGELTDIGRAVEVAATGHDASTIESLLNQMESFISLVRVAPGPRRRV